MQTAQETIEQLLAQWLFQPELDHDEVHRCAASLGFNPRDVSRLQTSAFGTLELYRQLIRGSVEDAIRGVLPVACAHLGQLLPALIKEFLADSPPTHRELRSLVLDFQRFVARSDVAAYLTDLMSFESDCAEIATAPETPASSLRTGGALCLAPTTRIARYSYAVHTLTRERVQAPPRRPCALVLFRDHDLEVSWQELRVEQAQALERIVSGAASLASAAEALDAMGVGTNGTNASNELMWLLGELTAEGAVLSRFSAKAT